MRAVSFALHGIGASIRALPDLCFGRLDVPHSGSKAPEAAPGLSFIDGIGGHSADPRLS